MHRLLPAHPPLARLRRQLGAIPHGLPTALVFTGAVGALLVGSLATVTGVLPIPAHGWRLPPAVDEGWPGLEDARPQASWFPSFEWPAATEPAPPDGPVMVLVSGVLPRDGVTGGRVARVSNVDGTTTGRDDRAGFPGTGSAHHGSGDGRTGSGPAVPSPSPRPDDDDHQSTPPPAGGAGPTPTPRPHHDDHDGGQSHPGSPTPAPTPRPTPTPTPTPSPSPSHDHE